MQVPTESRLRSGPGSRARVRAAAGVLAGVVPGGPGGSRAGGRALRLRREVDGRRQLSLELREELGIARVLEARRS